MHATGSEETTEKDEKLKLYEAGQELLADIFLLKHLWHWLYSLTKLKSSLGKNLANSD